MVKRLERHIVEDGFQHPDSAKEVGDLSPEEVGEHDLVIASIPSFLDNARGAAQDGSAGQKAGHSLLFAGVPPGRGSG